MELRFCLFIFQIILVSSVLSAENNTSQNNQSFSEANMTCPYTELSYLNIYAYGNYTNDTQLYDLQVCENNITNIPSSNSDFSFSMNEDGSIKSLQEFKEQMLPRIISEPSVNDTNEKTIKEQQNLAEIPLSDRFNYASVDAGAVVLSCNEEAKDCKKVLNSAKDKYCQSDTNDKIFIVIGLSESILVDTVVLANYERYSSTYRSFRVMGSSEYPTAEWLLLGEFEAEERNGPQIFRLQSPDWARFLKFRFIKHYGKEDVWTITSISVYGKTVMETLKDDLVQSNLEVKEAIQNIQNVPKQTITATTPPTTTTTSNTDEVMKDDSANNNNENNNENKENVNVNVDTVVDQNEEEVKKEEKDEMKMNEINNNNSGINTKEESTSDNDNNKPNITSESASETSQQQKQSTPLTTDKITTTDIKNDNNDNSTTINNKESEVKVANENIKKDNTTTTKSAEKIKSETNNNNNNNNNKTINETDINNNLSPTSSINTNINPTSPATTTAPTTTTTSTTPTTPILSSSIPSSRSVTPDSANSIFKILTDKIKSLEIDVSLLNKYLDEINFHYQEKFKETNEKYEDLLNKTKSLKCNNESHSSSASSSSSSSSTSLSQRDYYYFGINQSSLIRNNEYYDIHSHSMSLDYIVLNELNKTYNNMNEKVKLLENNYEVLISSYNSIQKLNYLLITLVCILLIILLFL